MQCPCAVGECLSLAQVPEGNKAIISCNKNLQTIERGLYLGMQISMFRNDTTEPNLIIAVGDARYVLDRRIAHEIRVKIV
jgi:Fe2+ transport system protein FeoA